MTSITPGLHVCLCVCMCGHVCAWRQRERERERGREGESECVCIYAYRKLYGAEHIGDHLSEEEEEEDERGGAEEGGGGAEEGGRDNPISHGPTLGQLWCRMGLDGEDEKGGHWGVGEEEQGWGGDKARR